MSSPGNTFLANRMSAMEAIERARTALGLTYLEIARGIGVNESTLHRWRRGGRMVSPTFQARVVALADLVAVLERSFPDQSGAREWLVQPLALLTGRTPREVLVEGRPDLLTGILHALSSGDGSAAGAARPQLMSWRTSLRRSGVIGAGSLVEGREV
jgi:transcriptional regulator with XRE-family HTH domain